MKSMLILQAVFACLFMLAGLHSAAAQAQQLHAIGEVGPRSQRVNMVFLSDGFTQQELADGKFADVVQQTVDYLFAQEPWSRYRSYFNVYRIEVPSVESGTDSVAFPATEYSPGIPAETKNTAFDAGFKVASIDRLLVLSSAGAANAYKVLNRHVPEYDIPIVMVNTTRYGGSGGPIAVASLDSYAAELVEHEVGHSFADLADEYDFDTPGYPAIEYPNATAKTERSQIRWNAWIKPDTKIHKTTEQVYDYFEERYVDVTQYTPEGTYLEQPDLVGLFEGANYRAVGWFRPHDNALMRSLGQPPGAVTREAFVLNYYQRVSPLDSFAPTSLKQSVIKRELLTYTLTPKVPSTGNPLKVEWKVDGIVRPEATTPTFQIASHLLGEGKHTVTATVSDDLVTPAAPGVDAVEWIKRDPTNLRSESVTWSVTLSNQGPPPEVTSPPAPWLADVGDPASFSVSASPVGAGALTYQWYKNGKPIAKATQPSFSLAAVKLTDAGTYVVRVTGDGIFTEAEADLVVVDPAVQTVVVAEGKPATLSALVAGPVQEYAWLRNDAPLPDSPAFKGTGSGKLVISPATVADHPGRYSLSLTTAAGQRTVSTHVLDVFNQPPQLVLEADASLPTGQVAALYGGEDGVAIEVAATPGRAASAFSASGLPPGLKVDAKTGRIRGRPTAFKKDKTGNVIPYDVTLTASNGKGKSSIKAKLLVRPLPEGTVGTYVAAVARSTSSGINAGLGGRLDLVTTAAGSFSGKLVMGSSTYGVKGALKSEPESSSVSGFVSIPRKGKPLPPPLELSFTLNGPAESLTGDVISAEDEVLLEGWLSPWNKTAPADAFDGYHTFSLAVPEPSASQPAGIGYGSFTLASTGMATLSGRLPDGEVFSCASPAGRQGQLLLFALIKGKPAGSLAGKVKIDPHAESDLTPGDDTNNDLDSVASDVDWWKPATTDPKSRIYPGGFGPVGLAISGGRYLQPQSPQVAFNLDAPGAVELAVSTDGGLVESLNAGVSIDAKGKAAVAAPLAPTTLLINAKTGLFNGLLQFTENGGRMIKVPYQGILTGRSTAVTGQGFYLLPAVNPENPTLSGSVLLGVEN